MGIYSDDLVVKEQTMFYIKSCVTEFSKLRPNRHGTREVLSPCLTEISKYSKFHELIHLCSEHDPAILESVLQIALEKCAEAERQVNEQKEAKRREESKKREAETQLGPENHKQPKTLYPDRAHAAPTPQNAVMPNGAPVSQARLPFDAPRPGVTANQDSQIESPSSTTQRPSAVVQAFTGSRSKSPKSITQLAPTVSSLLHLVTVSKDDVPTCDERTRAEDTQDWTGIEFDLESEEEMDDVADFHQKDSEYESGNHQEDSGYESGTRQADKDLQETPPDVESHDCNSITENATMSPEARSNGSSFVVPAPLADVDQSMKVTLESSNMASPLRSSVTASPPSQEPVLTKIPTKIETPTMYEVEKGLVRGVEKIRKYVMKECLSFSESYRAKKGCEPAKELRKLFPMFQKLPFEIVKDKLLVELGSRIMVPGQKTAIPSTVDLFNPSDILDALQCIKMTTINAKVNRAYGQMRLFKSVQSKIDGGYVPDNALTHGVAAHMSILSKMACRSAGNVSEKERRERRHSFDYEYDAGKRWVDVTKWFGGDGIVLILVTAGE